MNNSTKILSNDRLTTKSRCITIPYIHQMMNQIHGSTHRFSQLATEKVCYLLYIYQRSHEQKYPSVLPQLQVLKQLFIICLIIELKY